MARRFFRRSTPVAGASGTPVDAAVAALAWWLAREGLRD
jgi:hypothetical protein